MPRGRNKGARGAYNSRVKDGVLQRLCPRCNDWLPISAYTTRSGREMSYCLPCVKEYNREYHRKRRMGESDSADRSPSAIAMRRSQQERFGKKCPICGETKPLDQFYTAGKNTGGRNSYCKPCASRCVTEFMKRKRLGATDEEIGGISDDIREHIRAERERVGNDHGEHVQGMGDSAREAGSGARLRRYAQTWLRRRTL